MTGDNGSNSNVRSLRNAAQIQREASDWIARLNADQVSEATRESFRSWLATSAAHLRAYEGVSATWRRLHDAGELVSSVATGSAFASATLSAIRRSRDTARKRMFLSAAAAMLAVVCGTWLWLARLAPQTSFQTAIGEHASIELPDGSFLDLNSNSLARIDFSPQARVIRLSRGEAFFKVQHDAVRPFWVFADGTWIRAVGTAFNVDIRPSGVHVTVSEGVVKVLANTVGASDIPSDALLARAAVSVLRAGQQGSMSGVATEVHAVAAQEMAQLGSWRKGTLYFKDRELQAVIAELGRYTTLDIVVEDDSLRRLAIGGTFETNAQGAEALLAALEDGFGLEVSRDGDRVLVSRPRHRK